MRFQILRRHSAPPDLHVVEDLDAILISHLHLDHANPRSLRLLPRDTPLLVPTGAGRILRRYHFQQTHRTRAGGVGACGPSDGHGHPCSSRRAALSLGAQGRRGGVHDPGLEEALLRRRHRPVRRIGRPGRRHRRRSAPHLGMGAEAPRRPPLASDRRPGSPTSTASDGHPHPLGHVPAAGRRAGCTAATSPTHRRTSSATARSTLPRCARSCCSPGNLLHWQKRAGSARREEERSNDR